MRYFCFKIGQVADSRDRHNFTIMDLLGPSFQPIQSKDNGVSGGKALIFVCCRRAARRHQACLFSRILETFDNELTRFFCSLTVIIVSHGTAFEEEHENIAPDGFSRRNVHGQHFLLVRIEVYKQVLF
jgi:hypothetical protein